MLAVGLTLVIGSGGIDISVGSVLGFSSVTLGVLLSRTGLDLTAACLVALAAGTAFGTFNGFAVARLKLQPVVVTLSTMATARGLAYVIAGQGISSINLPPKAQWLQSVTYSSPAPVVLAIAVAVAGWLVLSRSALGRHILAVGSNEEAARLSGIDVRRTKLLVYAATGFLCGLAGVITAGMMNTSTTDAGMGYEFEAITAVLIGGTSISGGEATVVGSVFGVLAAALLNRGFGLMGISDLWRMMCLGVILIASVLLDRLRKVLNRESAKGRKRERDIGETEALA
jgi:ribose transport system permease protein